MGFEIPKQTPKEDKQIHLNFEAASNAFAEKDIAAQEIEKKKVLLEKINHAYPYAKIPDHIVEGDSVKGYTVHGENLSEYAKRQNDLYTPSDEEKFWNK